MTAGQLRNFLKTVPDNTPVHVVVDKETLKCTDEGNDDCPYFWDHLWEVYETPDGKDGNIFVVSSVQNL